MQRRRVTDCSEPEKTRFALLAQPLERGHHLAEHLPDAERFAAAALGDRIVQVEDANAIKPQSRQAAFERFCYGLGNAPEVGAR